MKLLEPKSNLASLAEGLGECYQLFLHNDSSSYSLTSWHRAKQLHTRQTEQNKAKRKLAILSQVHASETLRAEKCTVYKLRLLNKEL